ncbi:MAG: hypothetical protein M1834_007434 [Cirrosporium novae-zelandiae]|nr:MAG: hypothetical protein M1834_007434 [Cirrosporium novae-zelandiae]
MYGNIIGTAVAVLLVLYFFGKPVFDYFRDVKGLRRFPNMDLFSGMTNLSFMIESHKGFRSKRLYELHSKGMPVIRTGPNSLSYGDVRAIKASNTVLHEADIYGHSTKCTKDDAYIITSGSHFHLADVVNKTDHARKRKVLSSAYALKNLEEWEHKVTDKTQRLVNQFDKICRQSKSTPIVDYRSWTNFFSLDAIADIGLSERLGFLDRGDDKCLAEHRNGKTWEVNFRECLYANSRAQSGIMWSYNWYKLLVKMTNVLSPWYRRLWKLNEGWDGIVLRRASERFRRYQKGENLDDFFRSLMEDKKGNINNLEWGEIVAEVSIMMNAGSTTTAIAMANVFFQIHKHPEILHKLRSEIDSVLDPAETIAPYEKVRYLPYLRACLDESMRLYPPTSHGLPRSTPPEGTSILGEWIPGNTTVSMSAFVAHRDTTVFPDPETYNPDRWLGDAGKELQPYFIAFSAGARGCIGRNISYLEQTIVLATMLHRYECELLHPGWEPERRETLNLHLGSLPMKIRRREVLQN